MQPEPTTHGGTRAWAAMTNSTARFSCSRSKEASGTARPSNELASVGLTSRPRGRLDCDGGRPVRSVRSVRPPPALPRRWEVQVSAGGPNRQGDNVLVPGVRGAEEEVLTRR